MTISEPESTSIGGSENQQTTFKIELGVSTNLDSVSLSALLPTGKLSLSRSHKYLSLCVNIFETVHRDLGIEAREVHPSSEEWMYDINYWLWEQIKHTAITRFFEIWGDIPMPNQRIYSGLGINESTRSSVSGMISILSQDQSIKKDENGKWLFTKKRSTRRQYRYRSDLTASAIQRCKEVAIEYARKRRPD